MRKLLFLALLVGGCYHHTDQEKSQAIQLVWQFYGNQDVPPPKVEWLEQPKLDCGPLAIGGHIGWYRDARYAGSGIKSDMCVAGVYWPSFYLVQVADPLGQPLHKGALSHELWHSTLDVLDTPDNDHTDPGFGPGGAVESANFMLEQAGQ